MSPLVFALVAVVAAGGLVLVVAVLWRGLAASAGWRGAIAEHYVVTGDYPSVAEWRAGRIGWSGPLRLTVPDLADEGPVTVRVTVVGALAPELPGGAS